MMTDTIRKRRISFPSHIIARTKPVILTNRIFTHFHDKETKKAWFTQVERDLQEVTITRQDIKRSWISKKETWNTSGKVEDKHDEVRTDNAYNKFGSSGQKLKPREQNSWSAAGRNEKNYIFHVY